MPENSQQLLESALDQGRRAGALALNRVRLALVLGAAAVYLIGVLILKMPNLRETWWMVAIFTLIAVGLDVGAKRKESLARLSRYAVPVLDMPFVFILMWFNIEGATEGEAVAMFSLSIFLFLTVVSALSMRTIQVFASAVVASGFQILLCVKDGVAPISFFAGPVMLFLTAWMASDIPRRRMNLIRDLAEREARRNRLARYFSPGVAEVIEQHDDLGAGEECEISVLFADIRGFTQMSENLDAAEVVGILNQWHGRMVHEVFEQAGTLDKYLGDGLMAYFNAPVRQTDHAARAVKCALAMSDSIEKFNEISRRDGGQQLLAGIGIHCGDAVVGAIGAPHRREFTAIGDTVNVASRLQGLTREFDVPILVSEAVRELASSDPELSFVEMGEAEVRGRAGKVRVYKPERKVG
ncbi:MAG: adenylate cyclase [Verrucomicrobiales bacterium]|jgi:adenylate cyclase